MSIKAILFGILITAGGLFILRRGFRYDPIIWEAVIVGGLCVVVAPFLVLWGIQMLRVARPKKTDTALDALDVLDNLK